VFLFDLDCTLVDSADFICDSVNFALQQSMVPIADRRRLRSTLGLPLEQMLEAVVPRAAMRKETIRRCIENYREFYSRNHLERIRLFPGTAETLSNLRLKGFPLGVISSKPREPVEDLLRHLGVLQLFSVVVSGYEVANPKPSPDIVLEAARRLGVDPKRCVVVGDSPRDVEAGRAAQAKTVAVLTGPFSRSTLKRASPDFIIERISSLPSILSHLTKSV